MHAAHTHEELASSLSALVGLVFVSGLRTQFSHGFELCAYEPRNATQSSGAGLRTPAFRRIGRLS